jgi:hypothetical protein
VYTAHQSHNFKGGPNADPRSVDPPIVETQARIPSPGEREDQLRDPRTHSERSRADEGKGSDPRRQGPAARTAPEPGPGRDDG